MPLAKELLHPLEKANAQYSAHPAAQIHGQLSKFFPICRMATTIREATSKEDREQVYRLRYEIYIEEMGRTQTYADHERRMITEPFDDTAHLLLAENDENPVGTARINFRKEGSLECEELYDLDQFGPYFPAAISMTTKLMIREAARGSGLAGKLAMAAYRMARENETLLDFIDSKPHLVRLYQQMGYRFYKENINHPDFGTSVPLVLFCGDVDYLRSIRSPFFRLAREYETDDEAGPFFASSFPHYANIRPAYATPIEELWRDYGESLDPDASESSFLRGFSDQQAAELLARSDVIDYQPGDVVIKEGEESYGMFCLMTGQAEVVVTRAGEQIVVAMITPGDIFGEMGFVARSKRNASIVIREPAQVLVLSEPEFKRFAKKDPALALSLMQNLFVMVVERFNFRTQEQSDDE